MSSSSSLAGIIDRTCLWIVVIAVEIARSFQDLARADLHRNAKALIWLWSTLIRGTSAGRIALQRPRG